MFLYKQYEWVFLKNVISVVPRETVAGPIQLCIENPMENQRWKFSRNSYQLSAFRTKVHLKCVTGS